MLLSTLCWQGTMSILAAQICSVLLLFQALAIGVVDSRYLLSDAGGLGRQFDGIGGLSGGGATSRLLVNYTEPYQSQILDFLFKPNFGASLPILKVEIGGDSQSTDGTESSHMHAANDENYQRGYEWWLMKEAKKRNPKIKLYGLPWAFPGWIGNGTQSPYTNITVTVDYIVKWIQGAKTVHGLTIDYIGIWNERSYSIPYIIALRNALDKAAFTNVAIVAADGNQQISQAILKDKVLADAVHYIGLHYPGTQINNYTLGTNKPIWSSEDYSTYNDDVGAGCWARILNQNYVNGFMTCTISWNLIASYYDSLPFKRDGLMTANEPWSGHYEVADTIWMTAHTTQFSQPGWSYLRHGSGVQHLDNGGSFVSMTDGSNITIIIETMTHDHSVCIRPYLPPYTVTSQTASFYLQGTFAKIGHLDVWYSKLGFNGQPSTVFMHKGTVQLVNGSFDLDLGLDEIYTLTTQTTGIKGSFPASPPSAPFPVPYQDAFEDYPLFSEAGNFADQAGVWEIRASSDPKQGLVMEQVSLQYPVSWCKAANSPISVIGNSTWKNINVTVNINVTEGSGAFLAHRVSSGGCGVSSATGVFFMVYSNGTFAVYGDINREKLIVPLGKANVTAGKWVQIHLILTDDTASGYIGSESAFSVKIDNSSIKAHGFVAIGVPNYTSAQFDNFNILSAD